MSRTRKKSRSSDRLLGKCLLASLLGMAVYVTGNLEGQASARYAEPAPVTLWKHKPEKKASAPKQQAQKLTEKEYQVALAGCGDDWVCMDYLNYQRKQGRGK